MQESPFLQLYIQEAKQEALKQGIEQGERKGTIENIIALLRRQFNTDAVHALKSALESIEDLQDLRQLLLTVPNLIVSKRSCNLYADRNPSANSEEKNAASGNTRRFVEF